ncbi:hypothetical protein [Sphingomonas sp. S2-65]|uniref:hypothetical protein n=1 Tax=Sphingomonas sp. S2-65 TaxID=2903960 RepID=UPI001F2CD170|nr:hypothetical protein [Sphingomonas sp. S2-65]UYY59990.1 hypothetical protein LZ586_07865 [Sphingomonas sp. S2-65]
MIRLAVPAALMLTALSTGAATEQRRPDASMARIKRTLAGLTPGAPQRCLRRDKVSELRTARNVIVYVAGRDRAWRNDVVGEGCTGLGRDDIVVSESLVRGDYCAGDLIRTRARTGGMLTGSCSLGPFVPYTRQK